MCGVDAPKIRWANEEGRLKSLSNVDEILARREVTCNEQLNYVQSNSKTERLLGKVNTDINKS